MCVYINRRRYFYSRKSLPKPLQQPLPQPNYSLSPNPSPNGITPPNLPQGEESLTGTSLIRLGQCVTGYRLVSWNHKNTKKKTRSSLWRKALLIARKGSLHSEETPPYFWRKHPLAFTPAIPAKEVQPRYTPTNHPFVRKQYYPLPSPLLPFGQWPLVRRGREAVVGWGWGYSLY